MSARRSNPRAGDGLFRSLPEQVSAPAGLLPPPGGLAGAVFIGIDFGGADDFCAVTMMTAEGDLIGEPTMHRVAASRFDGRGGP